jgi:hypothetical protein
MGTRSGCAQQQKSPGRSHEIVGEAGYVSSTQEAIRRQLLWRGFVLEYITLAWNVVGIVVLAITAITARSVALAGFGLDSLIEIGASTVVIWELSGIGEARQHRALGMIGFGFALLAVYLAAQSTLVLATVYHPHPSIGGIVWTGVTAVVMFALALLNARAGAAWGNPVLTTEGRVRPLSATEIDGLATAVRRPDQRLARAEGVPVEHAT